MAAVHRIDRDVIARERPEPDLCVADMTTRVVSRLTDAGDGGQPAWLADGRIVYRVDCRDRDPDRLDSAAPATVHAITNGSDAQRAALYSDAVRSHLLD